MTRVALYPGSFDPLTLGHLHLIERAAALFDELIVVVGYNPSKQSRFSLEERLSFVRSATAHLVNVRADFFQAELLVSYARRVGATIVVRGLRSAADYTSEWPQAQMNRKMYPDLETIFLFATAPNAAISSTRVRAALAEGGDIMELVPDIVAATIVSGDRRGLSPPARK